MGWKDTEVCPVCNGDLGIGWDGYLQCKDCGASFTVDDEGNLFQELYDEDDYSPDYSG